MSEEQLPEFGSAADGAGGASTRGVSSAGGAGSSGKDGDANPLAAVLELEVPVSIELGRTQMAIEDVLALGKGSVVQLDRLVGQPVEVFVSDRPFATGEVVVSGDKFGVRILRIQEAASKSRVDR